MLTEIYSFDPEMILHSHFHFKSFPGHAKHRENERKNAKHRESERKNNTQRERAKHRESERKNESSDPATDTDLPHAGHAELSQTITAPNAADPR